MKTKKCASCEKDKKESEFRPDSSKEDGLYSWCKFCEDLIKGLAKQSGWSFPTARLFVKAGFQGISKPSTQSCKQKSTLTRKDKQEIRQIVREMLHQC